MSKPTSYAEAPQEIKDAVEQLIESHGHSPALLAGAFVASIFRALYAAKKAENDACALIAQDWTGGAEYIAAEIRKRQEA